MNGEQFFDLLTPVVGAEITTEYRAAEPAVEAAPVDPASVSVDVRRVAAELKARVPLVNGFMSGARLEMQPDSCRFFVSKAGLAIMSLGTPGQIKGIIASGDAASISQAQGVGKKTAERVILELKDKVNALPEDMSGALAAGTGNASLSGERNEAIVALTTLGYSKKEAESAVSSVQDEDISTEEYIKKALRYLM